MKTKENLVNSVNDLHANMNDMSIDKIAQTAPKAEEMEPQTKISMKELAKSEGIMWIEPKRKLPPFGTLPEKQRRQHDRDWEYVKGIFENHVNIGESVSFWFSKYPGDPDCLWEIPANKPVYVPRMIATHLETCMQYHSFNFIQKNDQRQQKDSFMENFEVTNTFYRGKFRPIGAFS